MDCVELTFVLFFSIHQVCGLGRRTVTEPKGSKRSDKFNSINGTGCPFQTLHTTSASAGNCVYTGNQLYDGIYFSLLRYAGYRETRTVLCWPLKFVQTLYCAVKKMLQPELSVAVCTKPNSQGKRLYHAGVQTEMTGDISGQGCYHGILLYCLKFFSLEHPLQVLSFKFFKHK